MSLVLCRPLKKRIAQSLALHALAGPYNGPLDLLKMILYKTPVAVDDSTVLADLTQPVVGDWAGYAAVTVVWGSVFLRPDGAFVLQAALIQWQRAAGEVAQNIAGYGLVDAAGTELEAIEQFDAPVPLSRDDDALVVGAQFVYGAPGDVGTALVIGP